MKEKRAMEREVKMAASLYEARDTARRLFGVGYKSRMDSYGQTIKSVAKTTDCTDLAAAIDCAKRVGGVAAMCYLAAAVELIEPTLT
jgi:hypothetical protein